MAKNINTAKEPKDIQGNESTPRQTKARLIKKRENSSKAPSSGGPNTGASTTEPSDQGASPPSEDLHSRIAIQAHELYQRRGGHHGQDWADWLEAERRIMSGDQ